jgi:hypothetical protein
LDIDPDTTAHSLHHVVDDETLPSIIKEKKHPPGRGNEGTTM